MPVNVKTQVTATNTNQMQTLTNSGKKIMSGKEIAENIMCSKNKRELFSFNYHTQMF